MGRRPRYPLLLLVWPIQKSRKGGGAGGTGICSCRRYAPRVYTSGFRGHAPPENFEIIEPYGIVIDIIIIGKTEYVNLCCERHCTCYVYEKLSFSVDVGGT